MEFYRQEFWNGLPFPSSGDLPNPRLKLLSLASASLRGSSLLADPPAPPFFFLSRINLALKTEKSYQFTLLNLTGQSTCGITAR